MKSSARKPSQTTRKATRRKTVGRPASTGKRGGNADKEPRYKAIADGLIHAIGRGDYPLGSMLPTEMVLSKRLKASRHTMREALRILTERGLILRRAGSGSCVIATTVEKPFTQIAHTVEQLLNYPKAVTRTHVAAQFVTLDMETAAQLRCPVGSVWFKISALRYMADPSRPLCWVDIYVLPKYAAVMKRRDHEKIPVHRQIELAFGQSVQSADVTVSVGRIPAGMAQVLQVEAGSPALNLLRRYQDGDGELFQITYTVHPEDRYEYSMNFRR